MANRQRSYFNIPLKNTTGLVCKKAVGSVKSEADCEKPCDYSGPSSPGKQYRPAVCRLPRGTVSKRVPLSPKSNLQQVQTQIGSVLAANGYTGAEANEVIRKLRVVTEKPTTRSPTGAKRVTRQSRTWTYFQRQQAANGQAPPSAGAPPSPPSSASVNATRKTLREGVDAGVVDPRAAAIVDEMVVDGVASPQEVKDIANNSKRSGGNGEQVDKLALSGVADKLEAFASQGAGGQQFAETAGALITASPDPLGAAQLVMEISKQVENKEMTSDEASSALFTYVSGQAGVPSTEGKKTFVRNTRSASARAREELATGTVRKRGRGEEEKAEDNEPVRSTTRARGASGRTSASEYDDSEY